MEKKDKTIILLTLYTLSLLIGGVIGFLYYGESLRGCIKEKNNCIQMYNNDCSIVKIDSIRDRYNFNLNNNWSGINESNETKNIT